MMGRLVLYDELAEMYDLIYASKDYDGEARRLVRLARAYHPSARTLLDVACGTGRHLAAFRSEFEVAGLDASGPMLALARRRLGPSVRLTRADMRSFGLRRQYDVLVCLFSAIGYLLRPIDRRRAFERFYRHLAPGGVALVEGWILPSEFRPGSVHLQTYDGPEAKVARVSASSGSARRSRIDMHYLIGIPNARVRHVHEIHHNALVEPIEMLRTMRAAGFRSRILRTGPYRTRGLYIGVKPRASARGGADRRPPPGSERSRV